VAIVGANGTGKSTLLKLMTGQLEPLDGMVKRHNHLRIGVYHQHLVRAGRDSPSRVPRTQYSCENVITASSRQRMQEQAYAVADRLQQLLLAHAEHAFAVAGRLLQLLLLMPS
jgi:ATPase subunit of ABC transporter with duplicated ATPase domains